MNPYEPPREKPIPKRMPPGGERSPAESAFDFILLPGVACTILSIAGGTILGLRSDDGLVITGWPVLAFHTFLVAAFIHWIIGLRRVYRSWRDPFGRVLRFVSSLLLLFEGAALGIVLLL